MAKEKNPSLLTPRKPKSKPLHINPRSTNLNSVDEIWLKKFKQVKANDVPRSNWIFLGYLSSKNPAIAFNKPDNDLANLYLFGDDDSRDKQDYPLPPLIGKLTRKKKVIPEESKAKGRLGLVRMRYCALLFMERMLGATMRRKLQRNFRRGWQVAGLGLELASRPWILMIGGWIPASSRSSLSLSDSDSTNLQLIIMSLDAFVYKWRWWEGIFPTLSRSKISSLSDYSPLTPLLWKPPLVKTIMEKQSSSLKNKKKCLKTVLCSDMQYSKEQNECASEHAQSEPNPTKVDPTFKGRASKKPFEAGPSGTKK